MAGPGCGVCKAGQIACESQRLQPFGGDATPLSDELAVGVVQSGRDGSTSSRSIYDVAVN